MLILIIQIPLISDHSKIYFQFFSRLSLSQSEEMEIDFFHLLKASNNPLILFDRIIDWVRRRESTLTSNDINSLKNEKYCLKI